MPPRGGTGMKWTTEERFRLLLTIIMKSEIKVSGAVMNAVAAEFGNGMTVNALSKQFNAIRKEYANSASTTIENDESKSDAAPVSKKRGRGGNTTTNGKKLKSDETISDAEDSYDELRPAKKTRAKGKAKVRTAEQVQDDDAGATATSGG